MSNDVPEEESGEDAAPDEGPAAAHIGHSAADSSTTDEPEEEGVEHDVEYVELAKVHNARDRGAARILKGILEGADIPCVIEDDPAETLDGYVASHLGGIDVFVPTEYEPRARELLRQEGFAAGFDAAEVESFFDEKVAPALRAGDHARGPLVQDLGAEARELRHEVLVRLAKRGHEGLDLARGILRAALRVMESPLIADIPMLADSGRLGREAPLHLVDDLAREAADKDGSVRRRVAQALGFVRRAGAAAPLVTLLGDRDAGVRDEALESLYTLSGGETFDFDPEIDPAKQEAATLRWREWVRDNPGV